jgi:hypothetical protein
MKYLVLIIVIHATSFTFCQVGNTDRLFQIIKEIKLSEFPCPNTYGHDSIDLYPSPMQTKLKEMLAEDSLTENTEDSWKKGLLDALFNLSKNSPVIYSSGLGTLVSISIDSLPWLANKNWIVHNVKAFIYSKDFGTQLIDKYGCEVLSSQQAYVEAYNKLTFYVLGKYYGVDVQEFVHNNVAEYIIKDGKSHREWCQDYFPIQ